MVLCTCGSEEEAMTMAKAVVEGRLAACVNVLPALRSVYRWEGEVRTDAEHLLLIKSTAERFEALRERIAELHSYENPEIIGLPIVAGAIPYLAWLSASV